MTSSNYLQMNNIKSNQLGISNQKSNENRSESSIQGLKKREHRERISPETNLIENPVNRTTNQNRSLPPGRQ